jgi:hypothetical protein
MPDVGNGRGYETDDDKRYEKAEELAEYGIEGGKHSAEPNRKELSGKDSEPYGNQDFEKKVYLREFHGV